MVRKREISVRQIQEKKESRPSFLLLLCLFAGVAGILCFFQEGFGAAYAKGAVYSAAAVCCALLWYGWFYRRKQFWYLSAVLLLVFGAAVFWLRDKLRIQCGQLISGMQGATGVEAGPVTELMLLLAVALSLLLFLLEVILKYHLMLYMLSFILLFTMPFYGVRPGMGTIVLLSFFLITFWVMRLQTKGREGAGGSMRMMTVLWFLCWLAVFPLAVHHSQRLYDLAFEIEGYLYRSVSRMSGQAGRLVADGRIHSGNNYRTGTNQLELTASRKPKETLYLRGFSGGAYTGGGWTRADDSDLFERMGKTMGWGEWSNMIGSMYQNMYFILNSRMQGENAPLPIALAIRHTSERYEDIFVPYCNQRNRNGAGFENFPADLGGYSYLYYEQSDMGIQWDHIPARFEQRKEWYKQLQDAYRKEVEETYTQVPRDLLPRLTNFVAEHPLDDRNEISAFILYTLHSNASYTLTPGWAPRNEDIAEYFLFESGRGYCEHFALTATLLYRLYGVPARYAVGYMVSPSDFTLQENGTYYAEVTDESAHAWTEIYVEDYGWTPVEVTPADDGSAPGNDPGFDPQRFEQIFPGKMERLNASKAPDSVDSSEKVSDQTVYETFHWKPDLPKLEKLWSMFCACLLYALVLAPFFLDYNRTRRQKKIEAMNCRKIFSRLVEMLHFGGYLLPYNGSEEDFALQLAKEIPVVLPEESRQMCEIVNQAAYGAQNPTAEQEAMVRQVYFKTAAFIFEKLKWGRRPLFRYW